MNKYLLSKAGINVNDGIHRFSGNKEMYYSYLVKFPEDEHYSKMLEAIEQNDVEAAFQASHALKGIAGTLSLEKLYNAVFPLVEELRKHSMEKVPLLLPPVKESYELVLEELKKEK